MGGRKLQVKRKFIFIITLLLALSFLQVRNVHAAVKKRIAVLDFSANNLPETFAKVARNFLETSLFETGRFQLLEREQVEMVFRENRIKQGYPEKTSHTVKIGKTLSVDYAIVGSLDRVENYTLTARVVSINEGRIVFAHTENISDLSRLRPAAASLSQKIVSALTGKKIRREENLPVKNEDNEKRNVFITASLDYLSPRGKLNDVIGRGTGFSLSLEYTDFFSTAMTIALGTGYYRFESSESDNEVYSVIPVSIGLGYRIELPLRFFLLPMVSGGVSIIYRGDNEGYDLSKSGNRKEFDPLSEAEIVFGYRVSRSFVIFLGGRWGGFWEEDGLKQYAGIGFGVGIGF